MRTWTSYFRQTWRLRRAGHSQGRQLPWRCPGRSTRKVAREPDRQRHGSGHLHDQVPVGHGQVPHQAVAQEPVWHDCEAGEVQNLCLGWWGYWGNSQSYPLRSISHRFNPPSKQFKISTAKAMSCTSYPTRCNFLIEPFVLCSYCELAAIFHWELRFWESSWKCLLHKIVCLI